MILSDQCSDQLFDHSDERLPGLPVDLLSHSKHLAGIGILFSCKSSRTTQDQGWSLRYGFFFIGKSHHMLDGPLTKADKLNPFLRGMERERERESMRSSLEGGLGKSLNIRFCVWMSSRDAGGLALEELRSSAGNGIK